MRYERVKYKLIDRDRGKELELTTDPMGWDESDKTLKRSVKTFGIWTELSKNLGFTEEAIDFLNTARSNRDVEAKVELEEWRNLPTEDGFYLHSTGTFNFSKFKSNEISVGIPFKTGGLAALIKAQLNEKFEMDRLTSINSKTIDALNEKTVGLNGRKIFLVSTWDTDNVNTIVGNDGDKNTKLEVASNSGGTRGNISALPLRLIGQSHIGFAENIVPTALGTDGPSPGGVNYTSSAANMFFFNSDQRRTLDITFTYDFDAWFQQYENVQWCRYKLSLVRFENGANLDFKERIALIHELSSIGHTSTAITGEEILPVNKDFPLGKFSHQMDGSYSTTVDLLAGESLCFELWLRSDMYVDNNAGVRVYAQDVKCTLKVEEESYFDPTQAKTVLMHDVGEKLLQIITGDKMKFKSDFYGRTELGYGSDGEFAYTGLSSGFWVRGFDNEKLEFSLDKLIKTANSIHNVGYTIERISETDVFVMEDMEYFFQQETTIILPNQVSNVERKTADDMYYANMKFGYKQPSGDNLYEEAMGLDEYNTQTGYTTPITRIDKKYDKISEARADSYGMEFARRKSKEIFPEEDTRYDKTVFVMDLKPFGNALAQRLWQDDYAQAPTGVFSPETATNLRLTPFRNSERHQWFFGSGLRVFQQEYLRYSNSIGNSGLGTKKTGEVERFENGDLQISEIEKSRFINEWITFEYEVDFLVNQQVYGTTEINGRQVPNYFGKIQFINEDGLKEYGYLFELKPNKEGKWKVLKAI